MVALGQVRNSSRIQGKKEKKKMSSLLKPKIITNLGEV